MNGLMRCNMIGETLAYRSVLHAISERTERPPRGGLSEIRSGF
jgi:hypothetical protein